MAQDRRLLGLAVTAYLLCAALYSSVIPVFEGFDAQAHFAAALYYRSERSLPVLTPELVERSYELVPHPPLYYTLAAAAGFLWPPEAAAQTAQQSVNAYFDKSLSTRQSITLPAVPWQALAPAYAARFVAMLGGLIMLLCTWWTARRLVPSMPTFALAAALVAALNPQFLFTAATISNDAWAAAMAALAMAAGVEVTVSRRSPRAWLWVGAAAGLAGLTKYSTLAVALPLGILWLLYLQEQGWRTALRAFGWAASGFALIAGWWFVRNWLLYGELVPFNRMAEVLPTMRRPEPYTWARTFEHIPWLVASFWGVFVAVIAPPLYLDATRWLMVIGLLGLLVGPIIAGVRALRGQARTPAHPILALQVKILYGVLLPWLAIVAAGVLYWTRTVEYGEQGRLAHIGASAFGILMVYGWQAWFPLHWRRGVHWLSAGGILALALGLLPFLQSQFGLPPAAAQPVTPDRPLDATFAGGMKLLGVDLPQGAALEPGQPLPLTLYFTTDAPIAKDYTLFLHVADAQDHLLYQFDGVPVEGRHSTRQWLPDQVFADTHTIVVDEIAQDGLATLSLGFYPIADPSARVNVYGDDGQPSGDRLVLAKLRLHHAAQIPAAPPAQPLATWENGITLDSAQVANDAQGLPTSVTLTWTPTATIQNDYTIFVQVLDSRNNILAQVDGQPQGGAYPTSTWRAGDVITDTLTWDGKTTDWARIIVGLYDADEMRLPVTGGGDFVEVRANTKPTTD